MKKQRGRKAVRFNFVARPLAVIDLDLWDVVRRRAMGNKRVASPQLQRSRISRPIVRTPHHKVIEWDKYDARTHLMVHCTIVASCNVENDGHTITPNSSKYVNENANAWQNQVLLETYRTFVGAANYREHVQVPALRKGDVADTVLREVNDGREKVYYCDVLVATERKHGDLIDDIESGDLNTLSMGTLANKTQCSRCGKVITDNAENCIHMNQQLLHPYVDSNGARRIVAELCVAPDTLIRMGDGTWNQIMNVVVGDEVVTHTGKRREVVRKYERRYRGRICKIEVEGIKDELVVTENHPLFACQPKRFAGGQKKPEQSYEYDFVPAGEVKEGDLLTFPVGGDTVDAGVSKNMAWLLGMYAAEGNVLKKSGGKPTAIKFTLNYKDELPLANKIARLLEKEFEPQRVVKVDKKSGVLVGVQRVANLKKTFKDEVWEALREDGSTVNEVAKVLGVKRSRVSATLRNLKVDGRRIGN